MSWGIWGMNQPWPVLMNRPSTSQEELINIKAIYDTWSLGLDRSL